jgi:hypothetical protein
MFMAGNPDQTYEKSSDYRHLIPHQKTVVQKKMKPTDILGNDRKNKITLRHRDSCLDAHRYGVLIREPVGL